MTVKYAIGDVWPVKEKKMIDPLSEPDYLAGACLDCRAWIYTDPPSVLRTYGVVRQKTECRCG